MNMSLLLFPLAVLPASAPYTYSRGDITADGGGAHAGACCGAGANWKSGTYPFSEGAVSGASLIMGLFLEPSSLPDWSTAAYKRRLVA